MRHGIPNLLFLRISDHKVYGAAKVHIFPLNHQTFLDIFQKTVNDDYLYINYPPSLDEDHKGRFREMIFHIHVAKTRISSIIYNFAS